MHESTAAFIAISVISVSILLFVGITTTAHNIQEWERENCPRIMEQSASDVHWHDIRRCQGYTS